jgi:hypothetical protein
MEALRKASRKMYQEDIDKLVKELTQSCQWWVY